jgi:hypothetical protein
MKILRKLGIVGSWLLIVLVVVFAVYLISIRPWHRTWGASKAESSRPLPGDGLVASPNYETTRAVTIKAPPEMVWPWLVQMGNGRGGLYSYDWIDRTLNILDGPSADHILPQHQDLKAGMDIPLGSGPGWPVASLDPKSSMVFDIRQPGIHITWSWLLSPTQDGRSRLLLRTRGRLDIPLYMIPLFSLLDVGEFVMVRKMLGGIKQRAEGGSQTPMAELIELGFWATAALMGLVALGGAFLRKNWRRPFVAAWASLILVVYLAFRQPPLWIGALLNLTLLAALVFAFRKQRPKKA